MNNSQRRNHDRPEWLFTSLGITSILASFGFGRTPALFLAFFSVACLVIAIGLCLYRRRDRVKAIRANHAD